MAYQKKTIEKIRCWRLENPGRVLSDAEVVAELRRERQKAHRAKPEAKARKATYDKERRDKPEYRAWTAAQQRERQAKPEVKARRATQRREHRAKPKVKAKRAAQCKERYENDVQYRLTRLARELVRRVIVGQKVATTREMLGCGFSHLRAHLEAQFTEGMTWGNRGSWHIDHITPLASFDLTNPEQMMQACQWSNLQPLWASENLAKGAKLDWVATRKNQ